MGELTLSEPLDNAVISSNAGWAQPTLRNYKSLEEIQDDLDVFMAWYNGERTNQGRYCQGRTPFQTFLDGLELYQQYVYENPVEEKEAMM